MRTTEVSFFSEGHRLSGLWRTPDRPGGRLPSIVQGPGWLGLKDAKLYLRYHEALTEAGFGVLIFDYQGFGESEGDRSTLSPARQLVDLRSAVSFLCTREDVDEDALGVFGSGGTGGGNAILLAEIEPRLKAVVAQLPVADGEDWLHRMRSEAEWIDFLSMVEMDRRERAKSGTGRLVHPREEIMVPTPERRSTKVKADVDDRIPTAVSLSAVDEIIRYRPVEAAARLTTPLLVVGIEDDATTPTDHAIAVYEAATGPKELIMQRHTTHYAAYDQYWREVTPRIVAWFERYVTRTDILVRTSSAGVETLETLQAS